MSKDKKGGIATDIKADEQSATPLPGEEQIASAGEENKAESAEALSDVPAFQLGTPTTMLSELSHEELLAEAQRYHNVEKILHDDNQALVAKVAELQAQVDAFSAASLEPLPVLPETEVQIEADQLLGDGARVYTPVYLKKRWVRGICDVGDCIGYVVTREGIDMNLLIDAVRNQVAGEERPKA